jgi:HD-GYP domain-containing protein (c-di-GMP phosphodiesterase class II)
MRLVATRRLTPGMRLARDVETGRPGAPPLLRAGIALDERYQRLLQRAGMHAIWIEDGLSEGIDPIVPLTAETRRTAMETTSAALDRARGALRNGQALPEPVVAELAGLAERIVGELLEAPDAALAFTDLGSADAYTHRHSVTTTIVGLIVGRRLLRDAGWIDYRGRRRFDRVEERLSKLGLGLLLHDIGKLVVPTEVLNKPTQLSPDEWVLMRSHPEAGVSLLPASSTSPVIRAIIRSHHERWDGSGYPDGTPGPRLHQFARLAAVADVFDAITNERPYRPAAPAHVGVRVIDDGRGTAFDPEVVDAFRRCVFPWPVGTEVELADGRIGVVSRVEPSDPDRPLVRVRAGASIDELQLEEPPVGIAAAA